MNALDAARGAIGFAAQDGGLQKQRPVRKGRRSAGGSDRHRARRDRLPGGGNLWYR